MNESEFALDLLRQRMLKDPDEDPKIMTTPWLVDEYVSFKVQIARGAGMSVSKQHRHVDVCDELRARGVIFGADVTS